MPATTATEKKRNTFYLTDEAIRRLRLECAVSGSPMSAIVDRLLVTHLSGRDPVKRPKS
jgi:hypothetical protein